MSGEAKFPAQINDVKAAIRFIRANAAKYNLNGAKIAVWGGSAGGALSAFAGTSGDVKELADPNLGNADQSDKVQAVVDWYGPTNFLTMDDQFKQSGIAGQAHNTADSFESQLMGQQITLIPDKVKQANPETYISADDPPFFIQHGKADVLIPYLQSQDFYDNLKAVLGTDKVSLELIEGAGHGTSEFSATANVTKALDFLDKYLKTDTGTATPTTTVVGTATPTTTVVSTATPTTTVVGTATPTTVVGTPTTTFAIKVYLPIIVK